jgi:septum site-determining protein MinC
MSTPLAIKGIGDKLVVSVPEGEWASVLPDLMLALDERGDFFRGAKIALQLEDRELGATELADLRQELAEREISLWALFTTSESTQAAAANLGLEIEAAPARDRSEDDEIPFETDLLGDEAVLIERTLRSGQRLRHSGHVIVLGDVNPGAEIIAGGHILVWGRLRGTVHAGASGNEDATVCALDLMPTQLRIAGHIAVSPQRRSRPRPEAVSVRQGQLVAEPWENGARHKVN